MAKELPYFKFEPNQWENGNIQILSREDKGLFIDLCCVYWSRLGDLPVKLASQKLCSGDKNKLNNLIDDNIIRIEGEYIFIKFLDSQMHDFKIINNNRTLAGTKGGESRAKTPKEARIKGRQFYVINCYNDDESFIKIGITSASISRRFSGKMPYKYTILFQFSIEENISLEVDCKIFLEKYFYFPKEKFYGYNECFKNDCIDELNNFLILRTSFAIAKQEIRNPIREDNNRLDKKIENKSKGIVDFAKLIIFFNANRRNFPEIKTITTARENNINELLKLHDKKLIEEVIIKSKESDFLNGINKDNWVATFDWIMMPENFVKLLEGNFDNKTPIEQPKKTRNRP